MTDRTDYYKDYDKKRSNKRKKEYIENRGKKIKYQREYEYKRGRNLRYEKRRKLFELMGGEKCNCCFTTDWWNLTIDHITPLNGNKRVPTLQLVYLLLENTHLLKEYQILCFGCNSSKHTGIKCVLKH